MKCGERHEEPRPRVQLCSQFVEVRHRAVSEQLAKHRLVLSLNDQRAPASGAVPRRPDAAPLAMRTQNALGR